MIAEQIDLFDVLPSAGLPWKELPYMRGHFVCYALIIIPQHVLSRTEYGMSHRGFNTLEYREAEKAAREEWGNYATAVWQAQKDRDWMASIKLLEEHRDSGKPVWVRLWKDRFMPETILEVK